MNSLMPSALRLDGMQNTRVGDNEILMTSRAPFTAAEHQSPEDEAAMWTQLSDSLFVTSCEIFT